MPAALLKKATIYPQKHRSGNVSWIVNVGKRIDGKPDLKRFKTEDEAKFFLDEWNLKLFENRVPDLAELQGITRHEILAAIGKLKVVGASISQAVDFFLRFGRPPKGNVSLKDAIAAFLAKKERQNLSEKYQYSIEHTTLRPFAKYIAAEKPMSSITREQVHAFLDSKSNWSPRTIKTHHGYLSTFFQWCLDEKYVLLNPIEGFDVPKQTKTKVAHWEPFEVWIQLQYALSKEKWNELAALVLTSFCGVRVEENERVKWNQVNLEDGQITMSGEQVKTNKRRFAEIPPVALHWLRQIPETKREGELATKSTIKNGLKRIRQTLLQQGLLRRKVQNGYRQAFAAYHYAMSQDSKFLSEIMCNSPDMVRNDYHNLVPRKDAEIFFSLFPKATLVQGLEDALQVDCFKHQEEIRKWLSQFKNPSVVVLGPTHVQVCEFDEARLTELKQDSELLRSDKAGSRVDTENWPKVPLHRMSETLASAYFENHRIQQTFGFSPINTEQLYRLKRVREHLEKCLEISLQNLFQKAVSESAAL